MKEILHCWIGMPSSPTQLTQLIAQLGMAFPPSKNRAKVVFENEVLSIADLAAGLDGDMLTETEIVKRASALGISEATALIGVRAPTSLPPPRNVNSLTYLGGIVASEEDTTIATPSAVESLYLAVIEGDAACVQLLLKEDCAGLEFRNEAGLTPLMVASTTERPDLTRILVDAGADVSLTSHNGYTALHWALSHPPRNQKLVSDVVALLSAAGADLNAIGTDKITPLMLACWFGADRAAELLVRLGADVSAQDDKGETAWTMARKRQNNQIVNMLNAVRA